MNFLKIVKKLLKVIVKSFSLLNLKDNEIYLLADLNINLPQNGNYILNRKGMAVCQGAVHTLTNKYQEFCQIFSLKQLIIYPARVTCNTSSLIDHILTNSTKNIFQSGIIDCGMLDHQLIFCTRKVKQAKFNKHNNVFLRFLNTTQSICLSKNCKRSISQTMNAFLA